MADDREFEHESLQDRATIARYLQAITEGFLTGSLSLSSKGGEIVLEPDGMIDLSVKAVNKKGRMQLTVRASWKIHDGIENETGTLSISANGR